MEFDAKGFLDGLYLETAAVQLAELRPDDLPADWRCEWEERAAVREYEGGQAREHAEAEALTELLARMRVAGVLP